MEEIIREISTMKMDVVVLTETKKKGAGSELLGNYIHLFSGVKKYERAKRGVSVLINKKWKGSIKNWESIDERILKLDMNIWGYKLTIIGIYAPNEDNKTTVKDEFFANLNEEIIKSGSGRQLILMGDMNGRTGRKTGDTVVGNFGEDMVNDNGERLIELCT
jgi:exonuclease III